MDIAHLGIRIKKKEAVSLCLGSTVKATVKIISTKIHLTNPWRGNICLFYVDINLQ
jgi:hypothetical protein